MSTTRLILRPLLATYSQRSKTSLYSAILLIKNIEKIFNDEKENFKKPVAGSIESLLSKLSDRYEEHEDFNVDYLIKKTKEYFRERKCYESFCDGKRLLEFSRLDEAEKVFEEFKPVKDIGINGLADSITDVETFKDKEIEPENLLISPWMWRTR